ncbi:MAG: GntR family transcriptional regulator [Verrucomicrobia bacterium]|nr:GntR family transcriptional regulator [Verrucomicrobiota bacterium]
MAPLHLQIDPHSGLPVYRQLMDQLRSYIASGALKAGDQLPSIRELAKTLAVNPSTVVKAYGELEHLGVIESQQGRGAFVAERAPRWPESHRRDRLAALAGQLALEAAQMGASEDEILDALRTAIDRLARSPHSNPSQPE